jgi:hypothetical protein
MKRDICLFGCKNEHKSEMADSPTDLSFFLSGRLSRPYPPDVGSCLLQLPEPNAMTLLRILVDDK